ncbi:MAG: ADP-ribosylglycohydrolase family protein [Kineosporiaceae bacterium]|nr:ADP-ribosylglycohydrolase family protein [Kineosporiaceae bacterium]MBK8076949.1 ADP-ribosylglycohydrolase family protein [Kineosporiaceae bacterium]
MTMRLNEDRVRGLMLGLLLGDAYDTTSGGTARVQGTCLAQLACFTLEGLIRASVRYDHKGLCHPPSVVWHAWCRWAHVQGLGSSFAAHWGTSGDWPDGWLSQVRPLSMRHGRAPATVAALRRSSVAPAGAVGNSSGHHALTRSLPTAIFASELTNAAQIGADLAGLTHGSPDAASAAAEGVDLVAKLLHGEGDRVELPRQSSSAPPGTAMHALHHGRIAAHAADDLADAIHRARAHGRGATTTAAALYGAANGLRSVPSELVNDLEIAWVADQLAQDAYSQITAKPGGTEFTAAPDPVWWSRYPGW